MWNLTAALKIGFVALLEFAAIQALAIQTVWGSSETSGLLPIIVSLYLSTNQLLGTVA